MTGPPAADPAFLLMALGRRVRDTVDARLADLGLTYRHVSALGHLRREPELSYSELGRRAGVTAQSMQATVVHLQDLGAVARRSEGRGRRARLQVTAAGEALLAQGTRAVTSVGREVLAPLDDDRRDALTAALFDVMVAGTARPDVER